MSSENTITAHGEPLQEPQRVRRLTQVFPELATHALTGQRLVLGREPGGRASGGVKLDDPEVSRRHADLSYASEFDVYRVRDRESKNGTFVDGDKLESAQYLRPGAVIRVGGSLFVYDEGPEGASQPSPQVSFARARAEQLIATAAPSTLPVLITGPTGTGKELLAEKLHAQSGRSGSLVAVNCATLSKELIGSELFGHVQGAFSGARSDRDGLFVTAKKGTLFLDEIAELPMDQQPALLRVLQERKVRPVGSDREVEVDVRVVAATHQDLGALELQGKFRKDLLARLRGVVVELPGLSARKEEVLPLFDTFWEGALQLSISAAEALLLYDWPMNVRELMHVAQGARLLHPGVRKLELKHLPETVRPKPRVAESAGDRPSKARIEEALAGSAGNVARTARALGCQRQALYRWMNAYGLDPAQFRGDREL